MIRPQQPPFVPDLVIFDCDGVLVDSEPITNSVFAEMLNELGLSVTLDDMYRDFLGHSLGYCLAKVETMLGRSLPEDFAGAYRMRSREALAREVKPVRGVVAVLDALTSAGIPFCVASSGDYEKMRTTLGATGLLTRVEGHLFSVVDVARPKPHPDLFLHVARRRSVEPARVVVVEDTAIGVEAAVSAEMTVYGYAEHGNSERLRAAGATDTFASMDELPALIGLA